MITRATSVGLGEKVAGVADLRITGEERGRGLGIEAKQRVRWRRPYNNNDQKQMKRPHPSSRDSPATSGSALPSCLQCFGTAECKLPVIAGPAERLDRRPHSFLQLAATSPCCSTRALYQQVQCETQCNYECIKPTLSRHRAGIIVKSLLSNSAIAQPAAHARTHTAAARVEACCALRDRQSEDGPVFYTTCFAPRSSHPDTTPRHERSGHPPHWNLENRITTRCTTRTSGRGCARGAWDGRDGREHWES